MKKLIYTIILISSIFSIKAPAQFTNHVEIRPGIFLDVVDSKGNKSDFYKSDEMLEYMLSTTNENIELLGRVLSPAQSYIISMTDNVGNKVDKSVLGVDNCQPFSNDLPVLYSRFAVTRHMWSGMVMFKPEEYFVITNNGVYTLQVQLRIWMLTTNKQGGVVVTSPPVKIHVKK
jgi:hypothetical protein